ncbi:HDL463Wp [Eremothecium sinecaudum]|uniref:Transcription initiation factor TFIID subunit 8 n=1 Tax=Eremothecium sinecaudum TaxID=45286 RepID=A0A120K233_9SACH|nr:HDL463Wp [Eremothecium sinecaudum]AMD20281.1 HDL463Wp [Eremothecium sinecaudum]
MTANDSGTKSDRDRESGAAIQLKKLPNLQEISNKNPMRILLSHSIALQLKTMNSGVTITQLGFDNLLQFIELQMDDMFQILHGLANIQRRNEISVKDMKLFMKGSGIDCSALYHEFQRSELIKQRFESDYKHLEKKGVEIVEKWHRPMSSDELLSSPCADFFFKDVDILNLVPPTNTNNKYVPKWLPDFPPDHTYRFTSLYNRPVTDEREMKKRLFEEGQLSEIALLNMFGGTRDKKFAALDAATKEQLYKESQEETILVFGPPSKRQQRNKLTSSSRSHITKGFNIEEYARSRVELARQQVEEFENHKLQAQKNPFIRAANICSPYGTGPKLSRKSADREFSILLQRSYIGVLKSIPHLKRLKEKEIKAAIERERENRARLREEQERKHAEQGVVDLGALHDDSLLAGLDSSDSEDEQPPQQPSLPQGAPSPSQFYPTLPSLHNSPAPERQIAPDISAIPHSEATTPLPLQETPPKGQTSPSIPLRGSIQQSANPE